MSRPFVLRVRLLDVPQRARLRFLPCASSPSGFSFDNLCLPIDLQCLTSKIMGMRNNRKYHHPLLWAFALFLSLSSSLIGAENIPVGSGKPQKEESEPYTGPVLSPSGKRRILENLRTLDQNIDAAQGNIASTDKNQAVIKRELEDLSGLEKEHYELRKKFDAFLADAKAQGEKNDKEYDKLVKYKKEIENSPKILPEARNKVLQKVGREKADIERWRVDSESKRRRINEMMAEVYGTLNQIKARRVDLFGQLKNWEDKRVEYERLLQQYREKKAEYQKFTK